MTFTLETALRPRGDQPEAIQQLVAGVESGKRAQVLLGITGSGKTFTMANVIAQVQRPTLVLAHNKTLAAQLYQEFKGFFPHNAVEYFVSYYDYYQPEAYLPRTDTYIEKDLSINDEIDKMRLSATRSLLEREDVLIVSSVSCIYGLGMPQYYAQMQLTLSVGELRRREEILLTLVEMHYKRNDRDFFRGIFRVRGESLEIYPAYEEDLAYRITFCDTEVESIYAIDPLTGRRQEALAKITIYASSHHVTPQEARVQAIETIKQELEERMAYFDAMDRPAERERIQRRTLYDLEMIQEVGFCKGVENYSRHFSQRNAGDPPACLFNYFPDNYLLVIDESHQTIPQMHAMYHGDRSRKETLIEFGFRLPSAYDNRPLRFEEAYAQFHQVIYVSATPGKWELQEAGGVCVEQVVRPTGLLDPTIEVRPATGQVDNVMEEIAQHTERGGRVLVTTLTKQLAEELTTYLCSVGVKAKYLHADVDTLERIQILRELRRGLFHVLVGINLLREGLDLPEVSLVAILDADKQGFLRSETALIQTCGRAARNKEGRVIMYADERTEAMEHTIAITEARRAKQQAYNEKAGITPQTIQRDLGIEMGLPKEPSGEGSAPPLAPEAGHLTHEALEKKIREYEKLMKAAAKAFRFEEAAQYRDLMRAYKKWEMRT